MRRTGLLTCLFVFAYTIVTLAAGDLTIYHFDVDQADCTLLISPNGTSVLFDCGDAGWNSSMTVSAVAPEIEKLVPSKEIDLVVLSHFHVDHVGYPDNGGIWGLLETFSFSAKELMIRDRVAYRGDSPATSFIRWSHYLRTGDRIQTQSVAQLGEVVDLGDGVTLTVCSVDGHGLLDPGTDESPCRASENDLSLGVLISYGQYQEWIGGDLSGETTSSYTDVETHAAALIGDVEVLRVNHHGSSHSSNATFVGNLDPEVSIISVGESKSHGHPDSDILLRLAATSDVYITTNGNEDGPFSTESFDLAAHPNVFVDIGPVTITTDGLVYRVNNTAYAARTPLRMDEDGDGYFAGIDKNDLDPTIGPDPNVGD